MDSLKTCKLQFALGQILSWCNKKWQIIGLDPSDSANVRPKWDYWIMNLDNPTEKIRIEEKELLRLRDGVSN